jgi:hypothetical protein
MAAVVINYLGVFSSSYRKRIYDAIKKDLKDSLIPLYFDQKGLEEIVGEPIEV